VVTAGDAHLPGLFPRYHNDFNLLPWQRELAFKYSFQEKWNRGFASGVCSQFHLIEDLAEHREARNKFIKHEGPTVEYLI
jgi:hypothetical protein